MSIRAELNCSPSECRNHDLLTSHDAWGQDVWKREGRTEKDAAKLAGHIIPGLIACNGSNVTPDGCQQVCGAQLLMEARDRADIGRKPEVEPRDLTRVIPGFQKCFQRDSAPVDSPQPPAIEVTVPEL